MSCSCTELDAGVSRMRRVPLAGGTPTEVPLAGGTPREVPLPVDGAIEQWTAHPTRPEAYITLGSWQSPRVFRYDGPARPATDTGWLPPPPADPGGIVTRDLRVPTRDGTLVPLRVAHRRDLILDGGHPAILTGYGSTGR